MILSAMLVLSSAAPAFGQQPADWTFRAGGVLSPNAGIPFMSQSVGSPAVTYDTLHNQFFMVFESRTPTVDARCPQGVWALGAATSPDGINWTPIATPVLEPTPGNGRFFSCVAAHPTAIFSPTAYPGGGILVFFKSEQDNAACGGGVNPSWGCDVLTGFGRLQIELAAATGLPRRVFLRSTPSFKPTTATFGYPKLLQVGLEYELLYQGYPDIWATQSLSLNGIGVGAPEIELTTYNASVNWVADEFYSPSLVCGADATYPYEAFVGGRDTNAGVILSGGWGKAIDDTWGGATQFLLDVTAQQTYVGDSAFRHLDVTHLTTDEYLVWFSERDNSGNSFIRFGGTNNMVFNNADVESKICP
ncbi:MAG: hypothetical protein ABMB14_38795 [Myxococcota bacterium]